MVTPFGRELRIIRLDCGELLKDMAQKLGITPAYLSSVENGKKAPTDELMQRLLEHYQLSDDARVSLLDAKARTLQEITLKISDVESEAEQLGLLFARKFDQLSDTQIRSITSILQKKE